MTRFGLSGGDAAKTRISWLSSLVKPFSLLSEVRCSLMEEEKKIERGMECKITFLRTKRPLTDYWKCNSPITPQVRLLFGLSSSYKREESYISTLLSENFFCVTHNMPSFLQVVENPLGSFYDRSDKDRSLFLRTTNGYGWPVARLVLYEIKS